MVFLQENPLKVTYIESFKDMERLGSLSEVILSRVGRKNAFQTFFNDEIELSSAIAYATCISLPAANIGLCIIAEIAVHPSFVSQVGSTLKDLLQENGVLAQHPPTLSHLLVECLHLDRSKDYDLSSTLKLNYLETSPIWQNQLISIDQFTLSQEKEIEAEIADMNLGQLQDMADFIAQMNREIKSPNKLSHGEGVPDD